MPQSQGPLAGNSYSSFNGRPLVASSAGFQPYSRSGSALAGPSLNNGPRAGPMPVPANAGFQSARSLVPGAGPRPTFSPLPTVNATPLVRVTAAETRLSQTGGQAILLNPKAPVPVVPIGLGTFTAASDDSLANIRSLAAAERAESTASASTARPPQRTKSNAFVPPMKRTSSTVAPPSPKRAKR